MYGGPELAKSSSSYDTLCAPGGTCKHLVGLGGLFNLDFVGNSEGRLSYHQQSAWAVWGKVRGVWLESFTKDGPPLWPVAGSPAWQNIDSWWAPQTLPVHHLPPSATSGNLAQN